MFCFLVKKLALKVLKFLQKKTVRFYKDSIIYSVTNADSAVYTIERFGANGVKERIVKKYYKSDYNELIFSPYNGVAVSNLVSMHDHLAKTIWQNRSNEFYPNGEIKQRSFSTDYISIGNENCDIILTYDLSYSFELSTEYGVSLIETSACCFNLHTTKIIGSIINGVNKGTTVFTGISGATFLDPIIKVNYNSEREVLQINSNVDLRQYTYSICDMNGRVLISDRQLTTNILEFKLFENGLYLFELKDKSNYRETFKFVK